MTAAALSNAAAALWPAFRRILRKIGRRILGWLVEQGRGWLLRHMRRRMTDFEQEIAHCIARANATKLEAGKRQWRMRRRRFERRLQRWASAADWIANNATGLTRSVLRQFEQLAARIPERAPWEED